jgi:octaprenyl-diphosphate synthase
MGQAHTKVFLMTLTAALTTPQTEEQTRITAALNAVERAMDNVVNSDVEVLRDASRHILAAGGKRVRPRLLMLVYLACGGTDVEHAAAPGAAVELMHTASVVHDDINDHGVLRRGRPSVNAIWGRTFALLTGDFLFTAVYSLLAPYNELNVMLAAAARALVEGETLQAAAVKDNKFTREVYMRIIALKTAALFQAAGEMGVMLAGGSDAQRQAIGQYSYNIGLAFQIADDILDIVGDEKKLGKTSGIDVEQGRGFASIQDEPAPDPMESIKRKIMQGSYLQEAQAQAQMLVEMAIQTLSVLPESVYKQSLVELANLVVHRDH